MVDSQEVSGREVIAAKTAYGYPVLLKPDNKGCVSSS
jgi:hypothetical protein